MLLLVQQIKLCIIPFVIGCSCCRLTIQYSTSTLFHFRRGCGVRYFGKKMNYSIGTSGSGNQKQFSQQQQQQMSTSSTGSSNNNDRLLYSPAFERNRDPILTILQEKVLPLIKSKNINTNKSITILEIGSGTAQHAIYFTSKITSSCTTGSTTSSSSLSDNETNKKNQNTNNNIETVVWIPSEPGTVEPILDWIKVTTTTEDDHQLEIGTMCEPIIIDVCSPIWTSIEDSTIYTKLHTLNGTPVSEIISCIVSINMIHIAPWSATIGLLNGAQRILPIGGILYLYGPFKRNNIHTAQSNENFDTSLQQRNTEWGVRDLDTIITIAQPYFKVRDIIEMPSNNLSVIFEKTE